MTEDNKENKSHSKMRKVILSTSVGVLVVLGWGAAAYEWVANGSDSAGGKVSSEQLHQKSDWGNNLKKDDQLKNKHQGIRLNTNKNQLQNGQLDPNDTNQIASNAGLDTSHSLALNTDDSDEQAYLVDTSGKSDNPVVALSVDSDKIKLPTPKPKSKLPIVNVSNDGEGSESGAVSPLQPIHGGSDIDESEVNDDQTVIPVPGDKNETGDQEAKDNNNGIPVIPVNPVNPEDPNGNNNGDLGPNNSQDGNGNQEGSEDNGDTGGDGGIIPPPPINGGSGNNGGDSTGSNGNSGNQGDQGNHGDQDGQGGQGDQGGGSPEGNGNSGDQGDQGGKGNHDGDHGDHDIALVVPESLYDKIQYYYQTGNYYNVLFYGQDFNSSNEWMQKQVTGMLVDSIVNRLANSDDEATEQMISSLNIDNENVKNVQESIRKELFNRFVEDNMDIYVNHHVDDPNGDNAKDIVYYAGKYNNLFNDNINPDDIKRADQNLVNAADKQANANDADKIIEALNKYQIAQQYAPKEAGYAEAKEDDLSRDLLDDLGKRSKQNYKDLKKGKEAEELKQIQEDGDHVRVIDQGGPLAKNNKEIADIVAGSSKDLLDQTNKLMGNENAYEEANQSQIINQYRVLAEDSGVPKDIAEKAASQLYLYRLTVQAEKDADKDLNKAVILASESVDKGNNTPGAKAILDDLSNRLLNKAPSMSPDKQEQAYEILSTRPTIKTDIAKEAANRKLAISYAKYASQLADNGKFSDAIFYASESNRMYDDMQNENNNTMLRSADALLKEAEKSNDLSEKQQDYRTITSAVGMPKDKVNQVIENQKAIDNFNKGMDPDVSNEIAVYYLGLAYQNNVTQSIAKQPLIKRSQALIDEANKIKDSDPQLAARYYKTMIEKTPDISDLANLKVQARQALNGLNNKDNGADNNSSNRQVSNRNIQSTQHGNSQKEENKDTQSSDNKDNQVKQNRETQTQTNQDNQNQQNNDSQDVNNQDNKKDTDTNDVQKDNDNQTQNNEDQKAQKDQENTDTDQYK
ncbi:hypothetical protein [Scopulibacillus cellulosilyticus]|uniref:Uncharacterized protein n=1 Tax=Scopulibacillus cellulosilyticus TaxID=2665665 RepID=A0ABW2PUT0_9BACL